jgi:hypothetical protein
MRRIYIAGRFSRRREFRNYAALLRQRGATIDARWLERDQTGFSAAQLRSGDKSAETYFDGVAAEDLRDLMRSNMLLSFTENDDAGYTSGGRHVEFGVAYVNGLTLVIVGPRENAFHCHGVAAQYANFEDFFASSFLVSWLSSKGIR